jgi:hypothetical protein
MQITEKINLSVIIKVVQIYIRFGFSSFTLLNLPL